MVAADFLLPSLLFEHNSNIVNPGKRGTELLIKPLNHSVLYLLRQKELNQESESFKGRLKLKVLMSVFQARALLHGQ
jgi:hypothetical protein